MHKKGVRSAARPDKRCALRRIRILPDSRSEVKKTFSALGAEKCYDLIYSLPTRKLMARVGRILNRKAKN